MLQDFQVRISYTNNNKVYASGKDKTGHYILETEVSDNKLAITLKPSVKMQNIRFTLSTTVNFADDDSVFCNGYQSWTDSRELKKTDVMPPLTEFCEMTAVFNRSHAYGDYKFTKYLSDKGFFHGMSYSYIRTADDKFTLLGSLNERSGYTIMYFNMQSGEITIEKELQGLTLEHGNSYDVMNLFSVTGGYEEIFDKYFTELDIPKPRIKTKCGYTSWYNYHGNINADIITRDLESLANSPEKLDIFQIDDGFQSAIGDWLTVDPIKFPSGLEPIAKAIHNKDMMAGLWLAPFAVVRKSTVYKDHKDWLVKDSRGMTVHAGANWGGFYALDIYNPEVRSYLKSVFDTVLYTWGFDMVKLDFLYAACIVPMNGKTRGEIMCDAMDLIRELCGDKLVLGCGVPLFPAFGKVDFCRIGCDVALDWKPCSYFKRFHREGCVTENCLKNTIFRRHLDGRAFVNDPDVFLLRDSNIKLNTEQKNLIAKINKLFGNLLFISDNISEYNDEQMQVFRGTIAPCDKTIIDAKYLTDSNVYIKYIEAGVEKELTFDIKHGVLIDGTL